MIYYGVSEDTTTITRSGTGVVHPPSLSLTLEAHFDLLNFL